MGPVCEKSFFENSKICKNVKGSTYDITMSDIDVDGTTVQFINR